MRLYHILTAVTLLTPVSVSAVAVPGSDVVEYQPLSHFTRDESSANELWKRKGGGGGGGRGGGSGGSSGSSGSGSGGRSGSSGSSGSGSSSSGSSGSSGSRGGSSGSGSGSSGGGRPAGSSSPSSNTGGFTKGGSGPRPQFGGGRYYGGGAQYPYRSGAVSPLGIVPFIAVGAAIAFWPGVWLYGAHMYPYSSPHRYYNASAAQNQTKPVLCACDTTLPCGCDDNDDETFLNEIIGNGSYSTMNKTLLNVADVNGTSTLLLNGTLPNGTTADGGDDINAGAGTRGLLEAAGFWPMVAFACAAVFLG